MGLVVSGPALLAPNGPLADDRNLGESFCTQLDDELFYLGIATERATGIIDVLARHEARRPAAGLSMTQRAPVTGASGYPAAASAGTDDISRNVFVVHGRDDQAREALFGFIEALGLIPLDWETLVNATGSASPYLRDVIVQGIAMAQAAVVLMTPDDEVRLHPTLRGPRDDNEARLAMQARANVILELGMALATYADRTLVLIAGKHRPMADLGGLNYIELADGPGCLEKIVRRLRTARCTVSDDAPGVTARAWFSHLAAYERKPSR
jgi:predicted nucleotide-binding protein